jgi:hypothetical protein
MRGLLLVVVVEVMLQRVVVGERFVGGCGGSEGASV